MNKPSCQWTADEDATWETSCGQSFVFIDDGPKENGAKFCIYCGGGIVAVEYKETEETDDETL